MTVPYISGKPDWNKNMVCRVIENTKYIGDGGFPKIISNEDFNRAAEIKAERNTYHKPAPQAIPQLLEATEVPAMENVATDEIERITSEINRLLESENADKNAVLELIIKCTQLKYSAIKEVIK